MADLPTDPDPDRDPSLRLIDLIETALPYSEANDGNVIVRGGYDEDEPLVSPSVTATDVQDLPTVLAQGALDMVNVPVQLDCYADNEATVKNLKEEVDKVIVGNRLTPGGIFSLLLPGTWVNNDILNQAEGFYRRTCTVTLVRYRSENTGG